MREPPSGELNTSGRQHDRTGQRGTRKWQRNRETRRDLGRGHFKIFPKVTEKPTTHRTHAEQTHTEHVPHTRTSHTQHSNRRTTPTAHVRSYYAPTAHTTRVHHIHGADTTHTHTPTPAHHTHTAQSTYGQQRTIHTDICRMYTAHTACIYVSRITHHAYTMHAPCTHHTEEHTLYTKHSKNTYTHPQEK